MEKLLDVSIGGSTTLTKTTAWNKQLIQPSCEREYVKCEVFIPYYEQPWCSVLVGFTVQSGRSYHYVTLATLHWTGRSS